MSAPLSRRIKKDIDSQLTIRDTIIKMKSKYEEEIPGEFRFHFNPSTGILKIEPTSNFIKAEKIDILYKKIVLT